MGDYTIKAQFEAACSPNEVKKWLDNPTGIAGWWSDRVEGAAGKAGDEFHVSFPSTPVTFELLVTGLSDEAIEWAVPASPPWWKGTSIRFELTGDNGKTKLLFTHGGFDPADSIIQAITPAWVRFLDNLVAVAESGKANPAVVNWPVRLFATRDIERPAEDVFAFFADAANNPKWQKGQMSCEWVTPPPVAVGSIYQQEARFLGRRVLTRFEVVEHVPGRVIAIKSVESSFPIRVRRTVERLGPSRSRVTTHIDGEPGGFFRIAGPILRWLAQRSVDADYDRLKRLLDARETPKQ